MIPGKYILEEGDTLLLSSFDYLRKEIVALQKQAVKEEEIKGVSDKFCKIQNLHLVNYWFMLAYLRIKDGISYEEMKEFLNFDKVKSCLQCQGVIFKNIEQIWNLNRVSNEGISSVNLNGTLQVGFIDTVIENIVDIKVLLEEKEGCCPVDSTVVDVLATQVPNPLSTQEGAYILI